MAEPATRRIQAQGLAAEIGGEVEVRVEVGLGDVDPLAGGLGAQARGGESGRRPSRSAARFCGRPKRRQRGGGPCDVQAAVGTGAEQGGEPVAGEAICSSRAARSASAAGAAAAAGQLGLAVEAAVDPLGDQRPAPSADGAARLRRRRARRRAGRGRRRPPPRRWTAVSRACGGVGPGGLGLGGGGGQAGARLRPNRSRSQWRPGDPAGVVVALRHELHFGVAQRRMTKEFTRIDEVLEGFFDRLGEARETRDALVGVPTGFSDLDKLLGGMQRSDLIILAARPGFGKSALALGFAYAAAVQHDRTVEFLA